MPTPSNREREWTEMVRANQALQRKYSSARDENDFSSAAIYKERWTLHQTRMRAFLATFKPRSQQRITGP